jgi:hypothetical protein
MRKMTLLSAVKPIDGVGDGTHLITASFIKTNAKVRDQLLFFFVYFSNLMHANIDGLKIHPVSTEKPLPILTSPKDKNIPTSGNKIRDYSLYRTSSFLSPECKTNQKHPRRR